MATTSETFVAVVLLAALGAMLGSLVCLLAYRLPRDLPVVWTRSRCPACGQALSARDLIPIFSWLRAGGRCRHCGARIGWRYPLIEGICMLLPLPGVLAAPDLAQAVLVVGVAAVLVAIVVIDLEHYLIPNELVIALVVAGAFQAWLLERTWLEATAGVALLGATSWLLWASYRYLLGRNALGLGDVKLMAAIGLFLPPSAVPAFFVAAGGLGVLSGMVWRALGRGALFPFGPSIVVAFYAIWLFRLQG